jgi:hypothetical protein
MPLTVAGAGAGPMGKSRLAANSSAWRSAFTSLAWWLAVLAQRMVAG